MVSTTQSLPLSSLLIANRGIRGQWRTALLEVLVVQYLYHSASEAWGPNTECRKWTSPWHGSLILTMFTQICFCLPVDFRIIIYAFRQGVSDQKVPNTIHRGLIGPCKLVIVTMSRDQSVTFRVFRYLLLYKYKIKYCVCTELLWRFTIQTDFCKPNFKFGFL